MRSHVNLRSAGLCDSVSDVADFKMASLLLDLRQRQKAQIESGGRILAKLKWRHKGHNFSRYALRATYLILPFPSAPNKIFCFVIGIK